MDNYIGGVVLKGVVEHAYTTLLLYYTTYVISDDCSC